MSRLPQEAIRAAVAAAEVAWDNECGVGVSHAELMTVSMTAALTAALPHLPAVNAHDDLVAALKEAIRILNEWCEEETGEGFNDPDWNALIAKAEGRS